MRKNDELRDPGSCLNRASENELLFVLLGRDPAAPLAIRTWCKWRVMLGKNHSDDAQIAEAMQCADTMDAERVASGRA